MAKVLKKHWVPILAPTLFKNEQLGESYVLETDALKGRGITVNLMNITGDMKKQNLSVACRITDVKEGKAYTRAVGIEMSAGSVKRLVRRGRTKIDDSFVVELKGGQRARVKPLVITKNLTNNSTATAVRVRCREVVADLAKDLTFETLVSDVVNMKLQRHMRTTLDSIYPIRSVDVRSARLLPKYTMDAEQPVEESKYVPAVVEATEEDAGERS